MELSNKCPLCGKQIQKENDLCDDCQNHVDNQYKTDFFNDDREQQIDQSKDEKGINTDEIVDHTIADSPSDEEKVESRHKIPGKKKISKTLLFIFIGCGLMVVIGVIAMINVNNQRKSVELEQRVWDSCIVLNTPLAYAKYLVTFQNGKFVDEAHKRIRKLRIEEESTWEKLKKSSDINDYYNYLSANPNTPYLKSARLKMDSLSWNIALEANNPEAYKAYLENIKLGNITGTYSSSAQEKYDYLSQIKPLTEIALDSLKTRIGALYLALSVYDQSALKNEIASKVNFYTKILDQDDIISHLKKDNAEKKIKKVNFQANKNSIKAFQDNKGITFIYLTVNKEVTNSANKKNYSVDTVQIELNRQNEIQSINIVQQNKQKED